MKELIVVRGLPGSGKSTFAKRLLELENGIRDYDFDWNMSYDPESPAWCHLEADMFFCQNGKYFFEAHQVPQAHAWCKQKVREHLESEMSVVVSNTFSRVWEMQPYLDMAKEFGCKLTVIECQGQYGNIHNVPEEAIEKMKARWEPYPSAKAD